MENECKFTFAYIVRERTIGNAYAGMSYLLHDTSYGLQISCSVRREESDGRTRGADKEEHILRISLTRV